MSGFQLFNIEQVLLSNVQYWTSSHNAQSRLRIEIVMALHCLFCSACDLPGDYGLIFLSHQQRNESRLRMLSFTSARGRSNLSSRPSKEMVAAKVIELEILRLVLKVISDVTDDALLPLLTGSNRSANADQIFQCCDRWRIGRSILPNRHVWRRPLCVEWCKPSHRIAGNESGRCGSCAWSLAGPWRAPLALTGGSTTWVSQPPTPGRAVIGDGASLRLSRTDSNSD